MYSDQARQRAEKRFKQQAREHDGRKALAEYEAQARAIREKTARLKALRLAKEAETKQAETKAEQKPAGPAKQRTKTRRDK